MKTMHGRLLVGVSLALLVSLAPFAGCKEAMRQASSAATRKKLTNDLKQLGIAFMNYHDATGEAPKTWDDLIKSGLPAESRQYIESQGYKLVLLPYRKAEIGTSVFLLAYPAHPQGDSILVLHLDGSVMLISREEFDQTLEKMQPLMADATVLEPAAATTGA
jgi:hypothetical protein